MSNLVTPNGWPVDNPLGHLDPPTLYCMENPPPDDILKVIAEQCVDAFSINATYRRRDCEHGEHDCNMELSGLTNFSNIVLVCRTFHEGVKAGLRQHFDGSLKIYARGCCKECDLMGRFLSTHRWIGERVKAIEVVCNERDITDYFKPDLRSVLGVVGLGQCAADIMLQLQVIEYTDQDVDSGRDRFDEQAMKRAKDVRWVVQSFIEQGRLSKNIRVRYMYRSCWLNSVPWIFLTSDFDVRTDPPTRLSKQEEYDDDDGEW